MSKKKDQRKKKKQKSASLEEKALKRANAAESSILPNSEGEDVAGNFSEVEVRLPQEAVAKPQKAKKAKGKKQDGEKKAKSKAVKAEGKRKKEKKAGPAVSSDVRQPEPATV